MQLQELVGAMRQKGMGVADGFEQGLVHAVVYKGRENDKNALEMARARGQQVFNKPPQIIFVLLESKGECLKRTKSV